MTEIESIETLKLNRPFAYTELRNAVDMAIQSLEEIQQYRAIGTVEELQEMKSGDFTEYLLNMGYTKGIKDGYEKAIDEFAEKLNTDVESFVAEVDGVRADLLTLDYFSEFVFEVSEELKGVKE